VQSLVVDPEVMRNLVNDGDPHLLHDFLEAVAPAQDW
jgi:hypothetical protein